MDKNYFSLVASMKMTNTTCLLLLCFSASFSSYSQTITKTLVLIESPLVIPAGVGNLTANCWGAGGGGGGSNFLSAAGGGGGGGGFRTGTVTVSPVPANTQISYTIGQGGIGGSSTTMNGATGGSTIFSTVTANGGFGGYGATAIGSYGAGGAGGAGSFSGGTGASAANVIIVGLSSGGGGGGAGSGSVGLAGNGVTAGAGGTGGGGSGGSGKALLGPGGNGVDFGGGGGGGLTLLSLANSTGGKGGNGQITVNYTCPTYSISNNVTATNACVSSGTAIVTLSSTPTGLPIGTYTVIYNRSVPLGTSLEASMVVQTAGSGTFTADGLTTIGSSAITITKLKSVDCISTISINNVVNVSVIALPAIPMLGTLTQTNCVTSTGSIVLNGLPSSGIVYQVGFVNNNYTITNATGTMNITGLAVGSYSFSVSNVTCLSSSTGSVVITTPVTKTWNGSSWSPAGTPSLNDAVIFTGNATIVSPLNVCSCQINATATVVVGVARANNDIVETTNDNAILTIRSGLNVQGALRFENNASLVQINDNAVNTGNIIYKRNTSLVKNFDYVYWCSPVEDQVLNVLSPTSDRYYSHAAGNWVTQDGGNKMNPAGSGFIIRVPKLNKTYSQLVQFIGKPHNGVVSIATEVGSNENFIGNPYPSAIDADSFITHNASIIDGALYFWTHNTPRTLIGSQYVYVSNDYATYTLTGATGVWTGASSSSGIRSDRAIAAGQSFFVMSKANGNFEFTNSMRITDSGRNSQFFKQADSKQIAAIEKDRVWLNLTNTEGAFKQLLVGYITGATNEFDKLYDGISFNGNSYIDFYSVNNLENYSIQGRGLPFEATDEVPLGYKTTIAGTFQISIDDVDGAMTNQAVYLEDKSNNSIHDLKSGAYSFLTEIGTFNDRFVLRFTDTKLSTVDFEIKEKDVVVLVKNSQIKINSFKQIISSIKVFDLKGSLLYEKNKVNNNKFVIAELASSDQVLIVKTQLEEGKWVSEKIIFQN
ncbi:T9SS sorting signal type C domain-containing protein [Flavobacterium sp. 5]|uniref:T9SS sorting signal type C domain-containing protein n=1 Tax=Flavobacterium sp. 5 TaxID=2035199 RepID=UPI000C2BA6FC|nr:T9SS sorting signal type C domain-containing protein [Flavobacterium sp. 5]PKB16494.1 hypothetical protein CLU82_1632 [Flavobacterium sp. 5]